MTNIFMYLFMALLQLAGGLYGTESDIYRYLEDVPYIIECQNVKAELNKNDADTLTHIDNGNDNYCFETEDIVVEDTVSGNGNRLLRIIKSRQEIYGDLADSYRPPVEHVYYADVNGDGKRDLCILYEQESMSPAQAMFYDVANKQILNPFTEDGELTKTQEYLMNQELWKNEVYKKYFQRGNVDFSIKPIDITVKYNGTIRCELGIYNNYEMYGYVGIIAVDLRYKDDADEYVVVDVYCYKDF